MTPLLNWALANAVLVVPLAVLAAAGSLLRRPVLAHALWLLVLLRLFAPPLWHVPLPDWRTPVVVDASGHAPPTMPAVASLAYGLADETPVVAQTPSRPPEPVAATEPIPVDTIFGTLWLLGAVSCLGLAAIRGIAFGRLVRFAEPAPAVWQRLSDRLARRIGLRRGPRVQLVHGPVSPLLWAAFGRPRILLPADLAARLDGRCRAALLAHELAHLRRGDHWVRWLELLATAAYWWHPVVWLARRGLREAEEQCCDAWVVWALPAARRAYADALVDTADFLSRAMPALPPLASGLGAVGPLRRRVVMIMRGGVPHRLSRSGLFVAVTIGVALLAFTPVHAQPAAGRPQESRPKAADTEDEVPQPRGRRSEEAAELRQQIRQLRRQLADAERKLAAFEGGQLPAGEALPRDPAAGGGRPRATTPVRPPRAVNPDQTGGVPPPPVPPTPPAPPTAPAGLPPGGANERSSDGRIRELERELANLRREITEMRREMRRGNSERAPEFGLERK